MCPPFDPRQYAWEFNQPLSFDTSSVTDMLGMFYVRSSPCPACPQSAIEPSPARCLHPPRSSAASRLPTPVYLAPHRMCPPLDSRQHAYVFNQPLSFDTSSVTIMSRMFKVRSSPCPAPNLRSSPLLHTACLRLPPPDP